MVTVKADAKGRLMIPQPLREKMGIVPGDTFFLDVDETHHILRFAKAENPFEILAEHALAEHRAGRTKSLQDFAAENTISLDDE